ncbi:MAG: hypothetical protein U0793_20310 [Gemmataceae bacterium]
MRQQLNEDTLEYLRALHTASSPGKIYSYAGIPLLLIAISGLFAGLVQGLRASDNVAAIVAGTAIVVLSGGGTALIYILRRAAIERYENSVDWVELDHDRMPAVLTERHEDFITSLRKVSQSEVWELVDSNKGLSKGFEAGIHRSLPKWVECDLPVYCLDLDGRIYYFFPEAVLLYTRDDIEMFHYDEMSLSVHRVKMYDGERLAGYQWEHQRIDGGPDRRFKFNSQIPIYESVFRKVSALKLRHDTSEALLMAENEEFLDILKAAIQEWREALFIAHQR